jgi:hypothetical protein
MKGLFIDEFVSIAGTSACQPVRSLPLKRLIVLGGYLKERSK